MTLSSLVLMVYRKSWQFKVRTEFNILLCHVGSLSLKKVDGDRYSEKSERVYCYFAHILDLCQYQCSF